MNQSESNKPTLSFRMARNSKYLFKRVFKNKLMLVVLLALAGILYYFNQYSSATSPIISMSFPKEQSMIAEKQIYIKGKVIPAGSDVNINDHEVARNGNGEFTAMVDLPLGKSTITINSSFHGKKSNYLFPIERKMSIVEEKEIQQKIATNKILEDKKVMGIKTQVEDKVNVLQGDNIQKLLVISDKNILASGYQKKIVGKILNSSSGNAYDVKVIATFYDTNGEIVDIKQGIAVEGATPLISRQSIAFATDPTSKSFSTYDLSLSAQNQASSSAGVQYSPTPNL